MPDNTIRPFFLAERSLLTKCGLVVAGIAFLSAASHIAIPMVPVPVTMQTFAVTLVGALFGWRFGALTIVLWLAAAAIGLPILSGNSAGWQKFIGPTAGYLFAFPFAAAATGLLVTNGWNGKRPAACFGAMVLGYGICLAIGAAWLGITFGPEKALMKGLLPFLPGAFLKSALATAVIVALGRVFCTKTRA